MKTTIGIIITGLIMAALGVNGILAATPVKQAGDAQNMAKVPIVFATYASNDEAMHWALVMAESIRQFGGCLSGAPIWVYRAEDHPSGDSTLSTRAAALNVIVRTSRTPKDARGFWFAGKVFASAAAETEAEGRCDVLAWLDPDEIFVKEPKEFLLPEGISFGYRPVMVKLIGSPYAEPPDDFWSRVYARLAVPDSAVFPVVSPMDQLTLRAYFNAGVLVARPERGLLRHWPDCFHTLYTDSVFVAWCRADELRAIFLHQAALAGNVLIHLNQAETRELPPTYNYPAYFHDRYPADARPKTLEDVVMFRHEFFEAGPKYMDILTITPSPILEWVRQRMPKR